MLLKLDGTGPAYLQVYRAIRTEILNGTLSRGMRLPSTRSIATDLSVARNTILQAFDQLLAEGYVTAHVGAGTFVADELPDLMETLHPAASRPASGDQTAFGLSAYGQRAQMWDSPLKLRPRPLPYDFRQGHTDIQNFPFEIWRKLLTRRARSSNAHSFVYSTPEGGIDLRRAIADYVRRSRGVRCHEDQVLVVNGSQQAFDLIARALLDPGDVVVMEDPGYLGAREAFRAAGARFVAASVDSDGLTLDTLPPLANRARLVYVTPSHQFPTGAIMPLARRLALLAWAKSTGCYIVEDDYDSEFRFDGRPVEAVQALDRSGLVIYLGTLSKTLFPGLRLGYLIVPEPLVAPLRAIKFLADRHTSTLQQDALTDFITEGHFERHLRRARKLNGARREAMMRSLRTHLGDRVEICGANAGLHMLVWLRDHAEAELPSIMARAAAAGVGIYPVTPYYFEPPRQAGLLLGYAALDPAAIEEGIARFAKTLNARKTA
ncbi:PLP-dependent aminotransferase family protein [Bradyrhizobium prioriisuperbiae]|uniref:MocR-like pyridoxine biosynthesis transcription factor PdxR n=1 Tax=Bradyrhizobium prioriisuperbiae TaxID=2854389 RepID=UPI0028EB6DC0|nr:PLP-dependent aminotransferase family protein [Bradyrhizobium prioritasuperba]